MAILTVTDTNAAANTVRERDPLAPGIGVDLNATGGNGNYTFSIADQPVPGAFQINASTGEITVLDGTLIDFETAVNGQVVLTIHVQDDALPTPNFADVQVVINVTNLVGATTTGDNTPNTFNADPDVTEEEDTVFGQGDNDVIDALGGNDLIDGGSGDDTISGGLGNDKIKGDSGDDIIVGGDGDDDIDGGSNTAVGDNLDGGAGGIDTLRYSSSSGAVNVNLQTEIVSGGDAQNDIIDNFENVVGSSSADTITGDDFDNVIEGGGGADILDGGDSIAPIALQDTISYANSGSGVTVTLGKDGAQTVAKGGDAEGDKITNFENILGSAFADTLTGNTDGNNIEGGAGADIMDGGSGDGDALIYQSSTAGVTLTLGAAGKQATGTGGHAAGDKFANFEDVLGSLLNDSITGNELDNGLVGSQGNDTIIGGAGNDNLIGDEFFFNTGIGGNDTISGGLGDDYIDGGVGSDIINGNEGNDVVTYENSSKAVTVALGAKGAVAQMQGGDAAGDKIQLVEHVIGSANADTITGNDLDNIIEGGAGADILDGGGGSNDTAAYFNSTVGVKIDLSIVGPNPQVGLGDGKDDKLKGFENIIGSANVDDLSGDSGANVIEGGADGDVMFGGLGDDIVSYANFEHIDPEETQGVDVALDNSGNLIVNVTAVATDADGDSGSEFQGLRGSIYDDILTGNNIANTLQGLDGDDEIAGNEGVDILDGGADVDTVSFFGSGSGVTVTLGVGTAVTIVGGGTFGADKISNFENIIGTAFVDTLTGNALDNIFDGNASQDIINGGAGNDTVVYDWAATAVQVTLGAAGAQTTVLGGDTDKISLIENVTGTGFDDTLVGNALNNVLKGDAGKDQITGGAGTDTLEGDAGDDTFFIGGTDAQNDLIDGGADDDTISVTGSGALTLENFDAGDSSIQVWTGNGSTVLGSTKNNILDFNALTSFAGILFVDGGTGNDTLRAHATGMDLRGGVGDDSLYGDVGADTLDGGDGEDTLIGGAGANTLLGGKGDDSITGGANVDTITAGAGNDFVDGGGGDDVFNISGTDAQFDLMLGGGGANDKINVVGVGATTLASFDAAASAIELWNGNASSIVGNIGENNLDFDGLTSTLGILFVDGGAGDDRLKASVAGMDLRGGAGDDLLIGNTGVDTLNGGAGNDDLNGAAGNDTIIVTGIEAQFDVLDGGADTDTLQVTGTTDVTLAGFNSTTNNIEIWVGNSKGLIGDASNNVINFSALTSVSNLLYIDGGAGDDTLTAAVSGSDLRGGAGADLLTGGVGKDTLNGGAGDDATNGGAGDDTIVITGTEAQFDAINGGANTDAIQVSGTIAVTLNGFDATASSIETWLGNGKGILGNASSNVLDLSGLVTPNNVGIIDGAAGNDVITGTAVTDDLRGGAGNDTLNGGAGADTLNGGIGTDILNGNAGEDKFVIFGEEGQFDTLAGGADNDTISFATATVTLNGFDATGSSIQIWEGKSAVVIGNAAANTFDLSGLISVTGYKSIDGFAGNDVITGVNLADVADDLRGGTGNDRLTGGLGNDKLTGGSGSDTFVFDAADFGKDSIVDFRSGLDDLEFDASDFGFVTEDDVLELATQVGLNTVITIDDQNTITLLNFTLANLRDSDISLV